THAACSTVGSSVNWNACAVQPSGISNLATSSARLALRGPSKGCGPVETRPLLGVSDAVGEPVEIASNVIGVDEDHARTLWHVRTPALAGTGGAHQMGVVLDQERTNLPGRPAYAARHLDPVLRMLTHARHHPRCHRH